MVASGGSEVANLLSPLETTQSQHVPKPALRPSLRYMRYSIQSTLYPDSC